MSSGSLAAIDSLVCAEQRSAFDDLMHRGPRQREHRAAAARRLQIVETANGIALGSYLLAGEDYVNARFENSVRAHVGGTDHQAIDAVARADDGIAGEPDARGRARELRKHEAGHQREREQAGERLDRNEDVGEEGDRLHLAVADGRHGLHAEEEHVDEIVRSERSRCPDRSSSRWRR